MPRAVITGASSGIGRHIAEELARRGYDLVIVARNAITLEHLAERWQLAFGVRIRSEAVDLALTAEVEALWRRVLVDGVPDILVNNAGLGDYAPFHEADWTRIERMLQVNVVALTRLTHLAVGAMRLRGAGRILNVSSGAAFSAGPLMAGYFASKSFILSFSEAIATENAGSGVTVTVLCPGATATAFARTAGFPEESVLFRTPIASTPAAVARYGVQALLRGQRLAVHGWGNRVSLFVLRFLPRRLAAALTHWVLRR